MDMRRTASEVIRKLEMRLARLEREAGKTSSSNPLLRKIDRALSRKDPFVEYDWKTNKVHFNSGGDEGIETYTVDGDDLLIELLVDKYGTVVDTDGNPLV